MTNVKHNKPVRKDEWKQDSPRMQIRAINFAIGGEASNALDFLEYDALSGVEKHLKRIEEFSSDIFELTKFPNLDSWEV